MVVTLATTPVAPKMSFTPDISPATALLALAGATVAMGRVDYGGTCRRRDTMHARSCSARGVKRESGMPLAMPYITVAIRRGHYTGTSRRPQAIA